MYLSLQSRERRGLVEASRRVLIMEGKCGRAAPLGLQPDHQRPTGPVAQDSQKSSADAPKAGEMVREIDQLVSEAEFLPETGINKDGLLCLSRWQDGLVVWSAACSGEVLTGERVPLPERRAPAGAGRSRSPSAYSSRRTAPRQLRKALQQEFVETAVSRRVAIAGAERRLPAPVRSTRSKSGSRAGSLSSISTISDDSWSCLRSSHTSQEGSSVVESRGRTLRRDGTRKKDKHGEQSVIQQVTHTPTPPGSPSAQPHCRAEYHRMSISPLPDETGETSLERVMGASKDLWILDGPGFPKDKYHRADLSLDGSRSSILARDDDVVLDVKTMRSTSVASRVARLERKTTGIAMVNAKPHEISPTDLQASMNLADLPVENADGSNGSNKFQ